MARFGPGLRHRGYRYDDVAEEAGRLRANGLRQMSLGGRPDGDMVTAAFSIPSAPVAL